MLYNRLRVYFLDSDDLAHLRVSLRLSASPSLALCFHYVHRTSHRLHHPGSASYQLRELAVHVRHRTAYQVASAALTTTLRITVVYTMFVCDRRAGSLSNISTIPAARHVNGFPHPIGAVW